MIGYIYKTTNLINGKIYVGKHASNKFEPEHYIGSGKILKQAIAKDGIENFKNELLDTADSLGELWIKEQQWIEKLDARNPKIGYNIAPGGEGGALTTGLKWYNDGKYEYYLPKDITPPQGLTAGRLFKVDNSDTVWIKKDNKQKHIKNSQLQSYLNAGWELGMLDRGPDWQTNVSKSLANVRDKAIAGTKEFHKNNPHWTNQTSWQPGQVAHNKGKISITNGQINKYISQDELDNFIQNNPAWRRGNTQKRNKETESLMENKQIMETLQMQPLTEEEKSSRHILGRLYGPIATCKEGTRNGRKYNKVLWMKALADEIFKEKVANKSLFLELGHPADREETDMTKVCACIPELPKIVNDDLYAYVDILDTPNGRLLKTYCDYGFIPGISSRGSGDIMANDEVDPETFFLETFDIVQLPAVKKARLAMCEGLDEKELRLRKALTEAYEAASDEDKVIMKESLENLDIKLESVNEEIPYEDPNTPDDLLVEEESSEDSSEEVAEEQPVNPEDIPEETEEVEEETKVELTVEEVVTVVEETAAEVADMVQEIVEPTEKQEEEIAEKVDEIVVNKVEEVCPDVEAVVDDESIPEEGGDKEVEEPEVEVDEISVNGEEELEGKEVPEEEVIDDEADEVMESLKEAIRAKDELELEVKSLKEEKTVSDAEVATLKEELNRYKVSFERTSELAAKSKDLEKEIATLRESLSNKDAEIAKLNEDHDKTVKLDESMNESVRKVQTLTENLNALRKELDTAESKLEEQDTQYKAKLTESINTAKKYKAKFNLVLNRYIDSKASMLGVKSADITSRLGESYTLDDIDNICDKLLNENIQMSRLPFGVTRATINSPKAESKAKTYDPDTGYEIDDDLLILAGLKK